MDIVINLEAFVATLSSLVGNREIKTGNKTKEEIVEGLSLRVTTPSCACEKVLEVKTDLACSGAQSGSVNNSWLAILPMANYHLFPSQRVRARASLLKCSCFLVSSCFQHSNCRINSIAALRGTLIFELMPLKHGLAFFITIVRINLVNRGESLRIFVNSCPIRAAFGVFLNNTT